MPFDDRTIELINSVIDGEASDAERAELEAVLASSPQAQRLFEATREVANRLDTASRPNPPLSMRPEIMRQVIGHLATSGAPLPRRRTATVPHPHARRRKVWFGVGWAAAAAIVIAVIVLAPLRLIGRRSATDARATMAPQSGYEWPVVATFRSTAADAELVVRRDGDLTALECVIRRQRPASVSLTWDESAATAVAISGGRDASSSKGQFSFLVQPGAARTTVIVRRRPGVRSVQIAVSVDSIQVIRAAVPLG